MIGFLNHIVHGSTRRADLTAFEKERRLRHADAERRRVDEAELYRRTNWRWSL